MADARAILALGLAGAGFAAWEWWRSQQSAVPAAGIPQSGGFIDQAKIEALTAPRPAAPPAGATGQGLTVGQFNSLGHLFTGFINLLGGLPHGTSQAQIQQENPAAQQQGAVPQAQSPAVTPASFNPSSGPSLTFPGLTPPNSGAAPMNSSQGLGNLLNLIAHGEANNGYDSYYAGAKVAPPAPISSMTVAQVEAYQNQMAAAGSASTAVGRYQFIGSTLAGLVNQGVLSPAEQFNQAAQDRAATALLNRRGLQSYQSGNMTATDFANNLAKEWASLPVVSGAKIGQSYYSGVAGNAARVTVPSVMSAVAGIGTSSSSA